ncbi:mu-crystallin [Capsaspora owczarzaki ATCC 30864]|uniref:mu-crystallin n=1 Tax=Capsaspora owczarzaki (strain ATCC 30864) TaxID=595528 RepID=UPI0001FE3CE8|nr:mu-crystallin [Capsaspora owczarzaki ATCC 30864]|eukprot:XP_004343601.1 mu-crystallin [Capsaspora owczarzaki ATCC 30864]
MHGAASAIPFYTAETVQRVLQMPQLILAMEGALRAFSGGRAHALSSSSSSSASSGALGVKLVTFYPHNPRGVATHSAVIALFEPTTGIPTALMDGSVITELRTAAVSAVAARLLAPLDSSVLCILGSGAQAWSHWQAMRLVRPFTHVRIWSRTPANAHALADRITRQQASQTAHSSSSENPSPVQVTVASTPRDAALGADVIVCATSATEPILLGEYVKPGAMVTAVGACRPNWREMDDALMQNSIVIADSLAGALKESGDIILSQATVAGELGELLTRRDEIARAQNATSTLNTLASSNAYLPLQTSPVKPIVFKSLGMAVEDVVAASLVVGALHP